MAIWKKKLDIKQFLVGKEKDDYQEVGHNIATYLEEYLPEYPSSDFKCLNSVEDLDHQLEVLYDWADINKVWLGL
jgi:hypothetical protein